jgi:hypothetical protein
MGAISGLATKPKTASGSITSTHVTPWGSLRTTTLHGSSAPI